MNCPYCGVSTDGAHETQEACIAALRAEISRVRDVLNRVRSAAVPGAVDRPDGEEPDPAPRDPSEM